MNLSNPIQPSLRFLAFVWLLMTATFTFATADEMGLATKATMAERNSDWRCGPIVYQVFVDRFVPSANLESKRHLYPAPKKLHPWTEPAKRGRKLEEHSVWSHEIDFWGGDLASLTTKLDYLKELGVDVLYLNPIHESFTNHKYGAMDYRKVSPEYGTRDDVKQLSQQLHDRQMRLMLDGVFNHMGMRSAMFRDAKANPESEFRHWFDFDEQHPLGYRAWYNVANLPEVNISDPRVRAELWQKSDSVVASYLKNENIDGWRLDVAYDIGPEFLRDLTDHAHKHKPGSWVIGEVWTDPSGWTQAMDGLMNFSFRQLVFFMLEGKLTGDQAGRILERQTEAATIDGLLKSWLILDNHDTPRLKTVLGNAKDRRFAQTLQFTMPGSPVVYYGVEAGMTGGDDPEMRSPMAWDKANSKNAEFRRLNELVELRARFPALKNGSVRYLPAEKLLAFVRYSDKTEDTVIVVANPSNEEQQDVVAPLTPWILNYTGMEDQLSKYKTQMLSGLMHVSVPAKGVRVLVPMPKNHGTYNPLKRLP